jgi:hypothetical protein
VACQNFPASSDATRKAARIGAGPSRIAEAHRRVDVAAGDLADVIGHDDDDEATGRGDAEDIDRSRTGSHSGNDPCAAAGQDKGKSSDEFRNCLFS